MAGEWQGLQQALATLKPHGSMPALHHALTRTSGVVVLRVQRRASQQRVVAHRLLQPAVASLGAELLRGRRWVDCGQAGACVTCMHAAATGLGARLVAVQPRLHRLQRGRCTRELWRVHKGVQVNHRGGGVEHPTLQLRVRLGAAHRARSPPARNTRLTPTGVRRGVAPTPAVATHLCEQARCKIVHDHLCVVVQLLVVPWGEHDKVGHAPAILLDLLVAGLERKAPQREGVGEGPGGRGGRGGGRAGQGACLARSPSCCAPGHARHSLAALLKLRIGARHVFDVGAVHQPNHPQRAAVRLQRGQRAGRQRQLLLQCTCMLFPPPCPLSTQRRRLLTGTNLKCRLPVFHGKNLKGDFWASL